MMKNLREEIAQIDGYQWVEFASPERPERNAVNRKLMRLNSGTYSYWRPANMSLPESSDAYETVPNYSSNLNELMRVAREQKHSIQTNSRLVNGAYRYWAELDNQPTLMSDISLEDVLGSAIVAARKYRKDD